MNSNLKLMWGNKKNIEKNFNHFIMNSSETKNEIPELDKIELLATQHVSYKRISFKIVNFFNYWKLLTSLI